MDVRIVYSPADALKLAQNNLEKHVMFFAIGFETTAPSTALTFMRAKAQASAIFPFSATTSQLFPPFVPSSIHPTCVLTLLSARYTYPP